MRNAAWLAQAAALAGLCAAANSSSKRGLVFTPNPYHPDDNNVWIKSGSDLTWYYNYQDMPSPVYASQPQDKFEFVPMMFGVDASNPNDTKFLEAVQRQLDQGVNIQHVLGFNEPDGDSSTGGSNVKPTDAALAWVANFEPLAKKGIKLGLPACTGSWDTIPWLKQFLGNCSDLVSTNGTKKNCTWDFQTVHWYDNFAGLASHIGERRATWPNDDIWVTEYAFAHQDLPTSQQYYNQTVDYFEKLDYIARYSYFGAFRSSNSNVGPDAAFLNQGGKLTNIGSWYLGFGATGVKPESKAVSAAPSTIWTAFAFLMAVLAYIV